MPRQFSMQRPFENARHGLRANKVIPSVRTLTTRPSVIRTQIPKPPFLRQTATKASSTVIAATTAIPWLRRISPINGNGIRNTSTTNGPKSPSPVSNAFSRLARSVKTYAIMSGIMVIGCLVYDISTYKAVVCPPDVPVFPEALTPGEGGPKALPVAERLIDDIESPAMLAQCDKPRLVVLGTGWGSMALLNELEKHYHVTVVSRENYFLFTPLLPSATVGTLELRSLVEPVRKIVNRLGAHFIKGEAVDVEFSDKLVEIQQGDESFYLPYDKLVIGVGACTNRGAVKGLENCHFLKTISDARSVKNQILNNLERACLPSTTETERRRLLSFVVSGGGPTGIEFAAELCDMINEDLLKAFPRILRNEISIHIIQSRGRILDTYDEGLSTFTKNRFLHDQVKVLTNSRVQEVQSDKIIYSQLDPDGKGATTKELPMGFCLWSTGVAQTDFCKKIAEKLGDAQNNRRALETDAHLRVLGAHGVYAIGDCATVQTNIADNTTEFFENLRIQHGSDPKTMKLTFSDWREITCQIKEKFPQAKMHLKQIDQLFQEYDKNMTDKNMTGTMDFDEVHELLRHLEKKIVALPATAQRAGQQGIYLGQQLNKVARAYPSQQQMAAPIQDDLDEAVQKPFEYCHRGSVAYIGNAAIFDFDGMNFGGGLMSMYLWRSIYFLQSLSLRTRILLLMDWTKRAMFGRGESMTRFNFDKAVN